MKLVEIQEQIKRIEEVHKLIEKKETGDVNVFAKKLNISKQNLFDILDELKELGAPIEYDSLARSYFYTEKCRLHIEFDIKTLNNKSSN